MKYFGLLLVIAGLLETAKSQVFEVDDAIVTIGIFSFNTCCFQDSKVKITPRSTPPNTLFFLHTKRELILLIQFFITLQTS